jgi:hypothetical protein
MKQKQSTTIRIQEHLYLFMNFKKVGWLAYPRDRGEVFKPAYPGGANSRKYISPAVWLRLTMKAIPIFTRSGYPTTHPDNLRMPQCGIYVKFFPEIF